MIFGSILNLSVMLGNYLQQKTSADNIFRCIFFLALQGLGAKWKEGYKHLAGIVSSLQAKCKLDIICDFEKTCRGEAIFINRHLSMVTCQMNCLHPKLK